MILRYGYFFCLCIFLLFTPYFQQRWFFSQMTKGQVQ
jgi:hypothetical protein